MSIVTYLKNTEMMKSYNYSDDFYVYCKLPNYIINTCILYKICDFLFSIVSSKYKDFDYSRRMYINKNIVKSLVLCYLSFKYHYTFYEMIILNKWNTLLVRELGYLYGSQDISGLIMVKNLPYSTKLHHTTVTLFVLINSFVDYTKFGLHRGLLELAVFSSFPYIVNTFLGLRLFVEKNNKNLVNISKFSYFIYSLCIICNIYRQILLIYEYIRRNILDNDLNFIVISILFVYCYLLMIILYDDFILVKYLYNYSERIEEKKR